MRNRNQSGSAVFVALGIFLSRIFGFIRDRTLAHYLGSSPAAGCFRAALRIPNLLQNLFGEGALSASFIPVYSKLLSEGKEKEAKEMASTVFSILVILVFILCSLGVAFSEPLTLFLAPGFADNDKLLTIRLVRIMFPGAGFLVLSAWCLGVLNSHRSFFLPYVAPVIWNLAIIFALVFFGRQMVPAERLVEFVAYGTVVGSILQLAIQMPTAFRLNLRSLFSWKLQDTSIRKVFHNFPPTLVSRGVVQISAYLDQVLSSFLGASMVAAIAYAQTIALLPISLFGISIATSELSEMSRVLGEKEARNQVLRQRIESAYSKISYFVIPSSIAFILVGGCLITLILQTGRFTSNDTLVVWMVLAAYGVGSLASTYSRLSSSTFWALHDTRTPLKCSLCRVAVNVSLGLLVVSKRDSIPAAYSGAALALMSSIGGWLEFWVLQHLLKKEIGHFSWLNRQSALCFAAATISGLIALLVSQLGGQTLVVSVFALTLYGALYLGFTTLLKIEESKMVLKSIQRRFKK